uniref:N-(5'-phosphoribosyl)anthranilate isomerase n=1 Tax=Candidatus Desulfatibia profunda TaxID=2841695 RepID=A0A8J6NWC5_9BACT|nr:phosphoribosylanthranilate isomerase [Candidatus Desulfatibia profunda]
MTTKEPNTPQIKICGLTRVEEALECAALGADAIGCVFYPKSPRHLTENQAREICLALTDQVKTVGVFVNETFAAIMRKVERCRLNAVQLHGREAPQLVERLRREELLTIKALFAGGNPSLKEVSNYRASAYLVECGRENLPGGTGLEWNWEEAKRLGETHPLILAGGLAPNNVYRAVAAGVPDALDVSSGVESAPGRKDLVKVKAFVEAVLQCSAENIKASKTFRKIF